MVLGGSLRARLMLLAAASYLLALLVFVLTQASGVAPRYAAFISLAAGVLPYQAVLQFWPGFGHGRSGMHDQDRAAIAMAFGVLTTVVLLVVGFGGQAPSSS